MAITVGLVHEAKLPVSTYGGTERVVWWLAKGLSELGVRAKLVCLPGSECPFAEVLTADFRSDLEKQLPEIEVFHHFVTPPAEPTKPYLVTIGGNGQPGETFLRNTVFVSRNHAERHAATAFVHNGIDPADYEFRDKKKDHLVFLAKASWRVKNVKGAIAIARAAGRDLHIMGGSRWWLKSWRGIHWEGMVGGAEKARWVSEAAGLLFPVLWHEPFGLAVVESLVSGTPVLATPFGSLPELVPPRVGLICRSKAEFISGIRRLGEFSPKTCREWALENFHYREMAKKYLGLYERVLRGDSLNAGLPVASEPPQKLLPLN